MPDIKILSRQLAREKKAREEAEEIAEKKSRMLYQANTELHLLAEDLAEKEQKTRTILNASSDALIVLNQNQNIEVCNSAACELFGYEPDELVGKNINELINNISSQQLNEEIASVLAHEEENILFELQAFGKNKKLIPVELAISSMQIENEIYIICSIRNITERKRVEQRLAVRHELVRLMAENFSLDEITSEILKIMCETLQLECGILWKVDNINNVLRYVSSWHLQDEYMKKFVAFCKEFYLSPGMGLPGKVWEGKTAIWVYDVTEPTSFPRAEMAIKANLHNAFGFPIIFQGEVLAVIEFITQNQHRFDDNLLNLLNDISHELGIFIEREHAQKRVAALSRLTGMAEVASNVLHNIGNALNSINTSIEMLANKIERSNLDNLTELNKLFQQHQHDLNTFLVQDPKGQHIPQFLSLLSQEWADEKKYFIKEVNLLRKNIGHVKSIIMTQQSFTHKVIGVTEETAVNELIEDALTINKVGYEQVDIEIVRDFRPIPKVIIDRVKLFQIIMNLIKNAIDSLLASQQPNKKLTLRLQTDNTYFMIQVTDSGVGVSNTDITKIFSHGFTTKENGHGFGLHTSALFAEELGGNLSVTSQGLDKGATFTLLLPYQPKKKDNKNA